MGLVGVSLRPRCGDILQWRAPSVAVPHRRTGIVCSGCRPQRKRFMSTLNGGAGTVEHWRTWGSLICGSARSDGGSSRQPRQGKGVSSSGLAAPHDGELGRNLSSLPRRAEGRAQPQLAVKSSAGRAAGRSSGRADEWSVGQAGVPGGRPGGRTVSRKKRRTPDGT